MQGKSYNQLMDKELNIRTTGFIEWPNGKNMDYNRTESTSYADLDSFMHAYEGLENGHLVDFGSGKGRVLFYFNHKLGMPTTGIEVNRVAFSHLIQNYADYTAKFPKRAQDITYHEIKAEAYTVNAEDNVFYFFNPFSVSIFEKVIKRIEASILEHPRLVDIILFYPDIRYTEYLDRYTFFQRNQTIKNNQYEINPRERFDVYRNSFE